MGKSLFGSKTKTKSSAQPWDELRPYILGDESKGIAGFIPEAAKLFESGGWDDKMQQASDQYGQSLWNRIGDIGWLNSSANNVGQGGFDSYFDPVGNIRGGNTITPERVNADSARWLQGSLNPTGALGQLLTGQVNNQYLDPIADNIIAKITRNTTENVFPQLRGGAIAANQYGGSREGIAEGLATSRMNQDIAGALAPLYGSAFENAQNRMQGIAGDLNAQAMAIAEANANRDFMAQGQNVQNDLNAQQFNANLGLQNNNQLLHRNTTNLANRLQGLNFLNSGNALADSTYANYIQSLMQPQNLGWQNLSQFYNVIAPTAQAYGTQKQTQTQQPGLIPSILGTAAGVAGIASGLGGLGGLGAMGGMGGGLTNFASGLGGGGGVMPAIGGSSSYMARNPFSFLGG